MGRWSVRVNSTAARNQLLATNLRSQRRRSVSVASAPTLKTARVRTRGRAGHCVSVCACACACVKCASVGRDHPKHGKMGKDDRDKKG